ncbi:hypothetical protein [Mycoplasma sp. 1654_15]|uniref:hypothetical protein n=1 Tax=Mycoplasma sp. 1654_15 TaxID=2725994 RepID=UPI0014498B3F|nr:hypothetical protein [Mycoplasma sp. 1654_15]QJB71043.1 hypothetical protein HF996_00740 [Mycoplasma sp. 1654_15]
MEFFKLNQGITLTRSSGNQIEIFIKEFKSKNDNTIIVKKGSYIKPLSIHISDKYLHRVREDVFKRAKILEKYEINSEKPQELQEDVEIVNCSVNKIVMSFLLDYNGNGVLKIKNDNKTLEDRFKADEK